MANNTTKDFYRQREYDNNVKLKNILVESLPVFCWEFFTGVENNTSALTRLNYAYDLKVFFNYLVTENEKFGKRTVKSIKLSELNNITATDIEKFLAYLSYYENDVDEIISNHEQGKARKLSTLRAFFKYFFNKDELIANVATKVRMPKIHEKPIIRLEVDEIVKILDEADFGANLTEHEQHYHEKTRFRDVALLSLCLGTGIRVSECVGINKRDIDFNANAFTVTRKGGNKTILYFSDEVASALKRYLDNFTFMFDNKEDKINDQYALFLSMQGNRMSIRSVEMLVKKYAKIAAPLKKISPHKLRSTYGTELYRETQDIYVVAEVLGHKDVNTTKRHYAAISDDIKRGAASKVKLRDDE